MPRHKAYQAFPIPPKEFESLKSYTVITFQANPLLFEAEEGNAWYMLLRFPNGKVEKQIAVKVLRGEQLFLVAVIPNPAELKATLVGVRAVILSHDAKFYFNAEGEMFEVPGKVKDIDWETATLLEDFDGGKLKVNADVMQEVAVGSDEHELILTWFRAAVKNEVLALASKEVKMSKAAKVVTEVVVNGMTFGIIFGEVFLFTGSWEIALANATLSETLRLLDLLFQVGKPNLEFPEYGSRHTTAWELAEKVVQLKVKEQELEKEIQEVEIKSEKDKSEIIEALKEIKRLQEQLNVQEDLSKLEKEIEELKENKKGRGKK
jgi:hypothetical protein